MNNRIPKTTIKSNLEFTPALLSESNKYDRLNTGMSTSALIKCFIDEVRENTFLIMPLLHLRNLFHPEDLH